MIPRYIRLFYLSKDDNVAKNRNEYKSPNETPTHSHTHPEGHVPLFGNPLEICTQQSNNSRRRLVTALSLNRLSRAVSVTLVYLTKQYAPTAISTPASTFPPIPPKNVQIIRNVPCCHARSLSE